MRKKIRGCPICGKPQTEFETPANFLPFCSQRCKQRDLGAWLVEDYKFSRPLDTGDPLPDDFDYDTSDR